MTAVIDNRTRPSPNGLRQPVRSHAIVAEGLRKEFPGGITAVEGVDLDIHQGEIFGFLGPNGAGKTTTVRMLTTLMRPSSGSASVAGFDLYTQAHDIRRSIGVALQEVGLDGMATGRELLKLQAQLFGMSRKAAADRAAELLELLGLVEAADRQTRNLLRRDEAAARSRQRAPSTVRVCSFLDEPTEGLDPASRRAVWQEIERLNREFGLTVFLTTHYMEEADNLADRLAIIDRGRIVAEGTPVALKAEIGGDIVTVSVDRITSRARGGGPQSTGGAQRTCDPTTRD